MRYYGITLASHVQRYQLWNTADMQSTSLSLVFAFLSCRAHVTDSLKEQTQYWFACFHCTEQIWMLSCGRRYLFVNVYVCMHVV